MFDSGEPISQWRREEIRTLPQELRNQCLLTMQARERKAATISDRPLTPTPQEVPYNPAVTYNDSAIRCAFGSDVNSNCFTEQERTRQMEILMVMLSRGFVFHSLSKSLRWLTFCIDHSSIFITIEVLRDLLHSKSHTICWGCMDTCTHDTVCPATPSDGMLTVTSDTRIRFLLPPPLTIFFSPAFVGSASRWHHQRPGTRFWRTYRSTRLNWLVVGPGVSTGLALWPARQSHLTYGTYRLECYRS